MLSRLFAIWLVSVAPSAAVGRVLVACNGWRVVDQSTGLAKILRNERGYRTAFCGGAVRLKLAAHEDDPFPTTPSRRSLRTAIFLFLRNSNLAFDKFTVFTKSTFVTLEPRLSIVSK